MTSTETYAIPFSMNRQELQPKPLEVIPQQDNPFTYGPFAKQPEYIAINRELVGLILPRLPDRFVCVDVGTGTGLVPQLIIEDLDNNKRGKIIGIDPNTTSLEIARRKTPISDNICVEFIRGFGQEIQTLLAGKIPKQGVDVVSILDALHEIRDEKDKITVVKSMADILKPEGLFIFNSAFTTEAIKTGFRDWARWKSKAMEILGGGKRDKQAEKMPIYTPEKYKEIIQNAGLKIIHETQKQVILSKEALKAISMYPAFIKGVFEDMKGHEKIPEKDKSDALIQALDEQNIIGLTRMWYEVIAQKPISSTT